MTPPSHLIHCLVFLRLVYLIQRHTPAATDLGPLVTRFWVLGLQGRLPYHASTMGYHDPG
jgi:hypothetical protein